MDDPVVEGAAAEAGPTPERPRGAGTALPAQVLEDLVRQAVSTSEVEAEL